MFLQSSISTILLGVLIGFSGALLGAFIDFIDSRRKRVGLNYGGSMLFIAGSLNTVAGLIAIAYSLFVTGSILTALILGLGVLIGFAIGFLLFAGIWIILGDRNKPA